MTKFQEVSRKTRKVDGVSIVTGRAKYTDDFDMPGTLRVKVLRSPFASARIKKIDARKARRLPGVAAVLTWRDLPRRLYCTTGVGHPEPSPYDTYVLDKIVRFVGDEVAIVGAETEAIAEEAIKLIEVEYEVLTPLLDPRKAMDKGAPVVHSEKECHIKIPVLYEPEINRVARIDAEVGDVERALADSEIVLNREFEAQTASHVPIEPHCVLSYLDEHGRLVVIAATQIPFHGRRKLARVFDLPVKKIRVIKPRLGGGFGGKQDVLLEPYAAAITLKTGRPAKYRMTRSEVFIGTRLRHNMICDITIGSDKDGNVKAFDFYALTNTGAYGTQGFTVTTCAGTRTLPLLNRPDMRFRADVVYTNQPVPAAYRGYGGTQAIFATVGTLDELICRLGLDHLEFYIKNTVKPNSEVPILTELGEGESTSAPLVRSCELAACITEGARVFGWKKKKARPKDTGRFRRGVGMTIMMQGSAIPLIDMASAFIKMNEDGSFNLMMGATELGQGSDTVLAQIAAEELTVATDDIIVYSSDTDLTPYDKGAYASSTTYLSGNAVKKAAGKVREQILEVGARMLGTTADQVSLAKARVTGPGGKSVSLEEVGLSSLYQSDQFQISAIASQTTKESPPPYAADFAEIEVDTYTGKVRVLNYLQAIDCGTPINPDLVRGQSLGGVVNGLSYALTERFIYDKKGKVLNPNYANYKIFGTRDIPNITTIFVPSYEPTGPFGAKSMSELSINGGLPVISNAIYDAVGVRLRKAPFTPDKVLEAIELLKNDN